MNAIEALARKIGQIVEGETKKDAINPSHYRQGKVECIDAIESATTGLDGAEAYNTGQIIKYIWRWKRKNGTEDLQKASWYLSRLIEQQEAIQDVASE